MTLLTCFLCSIIFEADIKNKQANNSIGPSLHAREPTGKDLILFLAFRVLILLTSKEWILIYTVDIIANAGFMVMCYLYVA